MPAYDREYLLSLRERRRFRPGRMHGYAEMCDLKFPRPGRAGAPSWGPKERTPRFVLDYLGGAEDWLEHYGAPR